VAGAQHGVRHRLSQRPDLALAVQLQAADAAHQRLLELQKVVCADKAGSRHI
jgi:hypothetical protein